MNIFELHEGMPRQGPGLNEVTGEAFGVVEEELKDGAIILDIGCGSGMQTLELARLSERIGATVVGMDVHEAFLRDVLRRKAEQGVGDRLGIVRGSMTAMPFLDGSVDLIWSEGAIFIAGFEHGLRSWRPLLKENGMMVISELNWLTDERPEEVLEFWKPMGIEVDTVEKNLEIVINAGYDLLGSFPLENKGWWQDYYTPMEKRMKELKEIHAGDPDSMPLIEGMLKEIELFRRYGGSYGYQFYIIQKTSN